MHAWEDINHKGSIKTFSKIIGKKMGNPKKEVMENVGIIVGLVAVQFLYAGNSIFLSCLLKLGFKPAALIIFPTLATFLILAPPSVLLERSKWPKSIGFKLWIQLFLLAFGGVTVFQWLFMKGVNLTSPAMATAMPNIAPGLIFFIAWGFRLEKVRLGCKYSRIKIAGTLLCVFGAVVMSLMQSTAPLHTAKEVQVSSPSNNLFDKQTIIGCLYLMAAVFVMSSQVVLQAATLRDFPAPISLCAITSFIGVTLTVIVELIVHHGCKSAWPFVSTQDLIAYSILAGGLSAMCVSFNAWAMKRRGPVMVSIFNPLGTVISVVLSVITLGETISVGSLSGMSLMFTGLYFVLWAKEKEGFSIKYDNSLESDYYDVEKPLLS